LFDTVSKVISACATVEPEFEVLLIDDNSRDETWSIIQQLASQFSAVSGFKLKENVGAYHAILTGFYQAKGANILVMAADGDDPPGLIPKLLNEMSEEFDAVLANREQSEKDIFTRISGSIFRVCLKLAGAKNLTPGGSDFMLFKKNLVDQCHREGWKSGNTLIQIIQHASSIRTIPYTKGRSRPSTWTFSKKLRLFMQTMNQFVPIPTIDSKAKQGNIAASC
jgi:glycosyltransferase involved in cell wall biosynthesis